jgi:DNA-binding response OmpR family regulator
MKRYRCLYIDDSKSVHSYLSQCLSSVASEIDLASNGAEGPEKFSSNPNAYDVIFLDWEKPVMDGPTTFGHMIELGIKTPVLMLTSKNEPSDIVRMIEAGVADYILKPFTEELILGKFSYVMGET